MLAHVLDLHGAERTDSDVKGHVYDLDTAAFYGKGHSESVVGRAIKPWKAGEEIYVFTKCGLTWQEGDDPDTPPLNSLRPESIRYECDQSLRRLGVD
ncbi:MAG: aldo/keto reductase, partial [Acidobacteria bacterium]|nr:aldo/keto reductase [Acidobacteriota bacterium]